MYLQNLINEEMPKALPWGDEGQHVALNIREDVSVDEDGNEKVVYLYDCVERVPSPITVESILKVAASEKFGKDIFEYVGQHFYNTGDSTVAAYKEFVETISEQAQAMGYE